MMNWQTEICRTTARTFEEVAFLLAEPDTGEQPLGDGLSTVGVAFSGPAEGELRLRVTPDIPPMVAANMLGLDEPPEDAPQWDALGEVANIICGNLLPTLFGADAVFRLQGPRRIADAGGALGLSPTHAVRLRVEGGAAEVFLCIYDGAPVAVAGGAE